MVDSNNNARTVENEPRSKRVELIVRQLESLPTLPVVATRLLQAATAKDISTKEVVSLIESDQALTVKILALTRKAHLGLGSSVKTVEKAVLMLGFEAVRNAVLSIQVFEAFGPGAKRDSGVEEESFDRAEFWKHCLAVACGAQLITEKVKLKDSFEPNEIFVCGLLHDLGKVALDTCLPKSFARIVKISESNRVSIADVERRILGLDHAAIGKRLAEHWQLPESIVHSIWLHHHKSSSLPEKIKYRSLAEIIYISDLIAREQRIGFSGNFIFSDNSKDMCKNLGIDSESYDDILMLLRSRMGERASMIGLEDLSSEELYRQALQGANGELGQLNQNLSLANDTLKSRSRYFEGLHHLHRNLKPGMAMVEMLEHLSSAVCSAMDIPSVIVYYQDTEQHFLESVLFDGNSYQSKLFEFSEISSSESRFVSDEFIVDVPDYLTELVLHYSRNLGSNPLRLLRLGCAGKALGGILISADDDLVNRLRLERQEVDALRSGCSLVIGQSLAYESKDNLADELLVVTRQMQELEQKLLEAKCMTGLGELAAGAAHEMNNPLAIISGRAQLLVDQVEDEHVSRALKVIVEQSNRASDIISDLMDFAKPVRPNREEVDLRGLLAEITESFTQANQLSTECISLDITEGSDLVFCDRSQLSSSIREILNNSLDACKDTEMKVNLKTYCDDEGQYVYIRISDNGSGMARDVLGKALDPFFSACKAGRRRGLGLSRAYRYIQSNNGMLWLESEPDGGTTVFIKVPSRPATISKDAKG